ncbi:MAG: fibrobacter succinogenes major paralogous domain-containing protein, partial [Bacteroidota bacterium]
MFFTGTGRILSIAFCFLVTVYMAGCKKEIQAPPELTTNAVTNIDTATAKCSGTILFDGGATIIERGFKLDTLGSRISRDPADTTIHTIKINASNPFEVLIDSLRPGTAYFICAYVKNSNELISFGNIVLFTTKQGAANFVEDIDGNKYPTITYHYQVSNLLPVKQVWMAANLKVTRYNNGDVIQRIEDSAIWKNPPLGGAYCNYDNDTVNVETYGRLYNWEAVSNQKICPEGWHVPTGGDNSDWSTLVNYVLLYDDFNIAGGVFKEADTVHWSKPNSNATNASGFTALPGGGRSGLDGSFNLIKYYGLFWTPTP